MTATPISVPGTTGNITGLAFGNPENKPIVALHGWLDNAASFIPLGEKLKDHYIIALDFAGHGLSDWRPAGVKYHFSDYVADVAHVISALGFGRISLMGHSLGAGVAMVYAGIYPKKVDRLVLIDGIGPITESAENAPERLRKAVDAGLQTIDGVAKAAKKTRQWEALVIARQQASPLTRAAAELLLSRGSTEGSEGATVNADPAVKHPSPFYFNEQMVSSFISKVTAPTLLLLATQGMVISRSYTPDRIKTFCDIQVVECDGQHHLHMDQPDQVVIPVQRFLVS